uniref:Uncharacterized protein n=1 Tax=viral metagenome TaxID=1070528 RepID=A0A6C0BCD3_9ZZZZ
MGNTNTTNAKLNQTQMNLTPSPSSSPTTIESQAAAATSQINALLAQSKESLMCGPACQAQKNISGLEQTYVNAENNVKTAPEQLDEAKKNYYLALKGQSEYNKMILDDATKDADKLIKSLQEKFDEAGINTERQININDSLETNYHHMNDLYLQYSEENEKMDRTLKKVRDDIVTNDRKTYYEQQYIDSLESRYYWYRLLYIFLLLIIIGVVLFKYSGSWIKKLLIIICFILYPIFIVPIVIYLMKCIQYILGFFPKNVYHKAKTM